MSCGCGSGCGCGTKKCPCTLVDDRGRPYAGAGTSCDPYVIPRLDHAPPKLYANDDGSFTFVPGDGGAPVVIPASDSTVPPATLTDNGDGTLLFEDGRGGSSTIDICAIVATCP